MASEEHTGSYYAATRNDVTTYPELEGDHDTDVCIIGGGFTGVACALTMAERGHRVIIIEQHRISWGASGRNGGQLIAGLGGSKHLAKQLGWEKINELNYRGNDIIKERVKKYDIDCDLKSGYMEVAFKKSQMEYLKEDYQDHVDQGLGAHLTMLDRDAVREALGTDAYVGGMINNLNGHLHPLNLCAGEARAAVGLGTRIFEQSEVTGIEHGAVAKVKTTKGSVSAKQVLIAGNAYHKLEPGKLSGLVFPAGSFIIATEPLSENLVEKINPKD
ncbi:MAG: FAD-binding oxidoreductase, partial [Pseudomonadales bacterium]|nr:FAD-binding oxidoreductase [Pseudomonadales bacterium]